MRSINRLSLLCRSRRLNTGRDIDSTIDTDKPKDVLTFPHNDVVHRRLPRAYR